MILCHLHCLQSLILIFLKRYMACNGLPFSTKLISSNLFSFYKEVADFIKHLDSYFIYSWSTLLVLLVICDPYYNYTIIYSTGILIYRHNLVLTIVIIAIDIVSNNFLNLSFQNFQLYFFNIIYTYF